MPEENIVNVKWLIGVYSAIVAALAGVVGLFTRSWASRQTKRVDGHGERIRAVEKTQAVHTEILKRVEVKLDKVKAAVCKE